MGIGSIGSATSFWEQDQNYWNEQKSYASSAAASNSLINAMATAETNLGKGLASIANQTALSRVNSQLTAAIQSILSGSATTSGSTSSSSSSGSSTSSASPATGTGTAPVTTSTPLTSLGIPAGGTITISAGGHTTTYASTGSDTVGDLMSAINEDYFGNAPVTASLNRDGELVLTSKNDTATITVGGVYASNIGFGVGHNTFEPTKTSSSASSSSSPSSTTSASSATASSASSATSTSKSSKSYTTPASETASSAASLLSDSGAGGSLVDMLA